MVWSQPMLMNMEPRYYTDSGQFAAERQSIFRRYWQMAGPTSRLSKPGDYLTLDVTGWQLFVVKGRDGQNRAFHNVCRHRGARILEGQVGHCELLRCPYHNWVYDTFGTLRTTPLFGEDLGFDRADWPLEPAHLTEWRGLFFVAIDPVMTLAQQLGDLPEELAEFPVETYQAIEQHRFEANTNWKTYTDNFVEGYHIPGIHPQFSKTVDIAGFQSTVLDGLVRMVAPQKETSIYRGKWLWMWPNWTLSTFPGGMNTSRINPISIDKIEIIYDFYFADLSAATEASRRSTIDTSCSIVREDFGVCEDTQKNYVSGGYRPGPLSPRHEKSVAYFQAKIIDHGLALGS